MFYNLADGKPVDATQELLTIGLCNIGNSFFHAYPGSGSFSRCAVTSASGVRTPLEGLYAGEINVFESWNIKKKLFCILLLTYYIDRVN